MAEGVKDALFQHTLSKKGSQVEERDLGSISTGEKAVVWAHAVLNPKAFMWKNFWKCPNLEEAFTRA